MAKVTITITPNGTTVDLGCITGAQCSVVMKNVLENIVKPKGEVAVTTKPEYYEEPAAVNATGQTEGATQS